MSEEIKKLNKLLDKLDKNIEFIKSGAIVDNSNVSPIKVQRISYYKKGNMFLFLTEQLDSYLCFDVDSFDKAMAKKETL